MRGAKMQRPSDEHKSAFRVRHVLVVDDDADINRLLCTRLSARGYSVDSASSGEEALERIAARPPDLIILDVAMPGIGGLDVLADVRRRELDVAVIMSTAYGSEQLAVDALRQGADDYLRKPFEPSELRVVVDRTVQQLELRRQNLALRQQLEEKHHQFQIELVRAADVQAGLLPRSFPSIAGFELAAECAPAREVGGDFYDWQQPAPHRLSLWLCDVMGKGMAAALLMATVRAVMRAVVRGSFPVEALGYITAALEEDLFQSDRFVTLFIAHLDTQTRQLSYVDAGHGLAFVRRANGDAETLGVRGLPLGVLPDEHYVEASVTLQPGDALVVYSDGLIDALPDLDLTPEFLSRQLEGAHSALAMVDRLVTLLAPVGTPPDDVTLLVLYCVQQEEHTTVLSDSCIK